MSDRVDVVPFQAVAAPAPWLGTAHAVKVRRWPELQGGAQLGGYVPAEVSHGAYENAIVDNGLQESASGGSPGEADRDGPSTDDVTGLTRVGVAAAVGAFVANYDEIGPTGPASAGAGHDLDQSIGGMGSEGLSFALGPCRSAQTDGVGFDAVDQGHAHRRRQGTRKAHHAEAVCPVAESASGVLTGQELFG